MPKRPTTSRKPQAKVVKRTSKHAKSKAAKARDEKLSGEIDAVLVKEGFLQAGRSEKKAEETEMEVEGEKEGGGGGETTGCGKVGVEELLKELGML